MSLKHIVKGVANRTRGKLGVLDSATKSLGDSRMAICRECPIYVGGKCDSSKGGCGCHMKSKVLVKGASCPKAKW